MTLGEQIKKARKSASLGQHEVAEALGVTHSVISRYETGKIVPPVEKLEQMSKLFGVRFFTKNVTYGDKQFEVGRYTIWKDHWPIGTINLYPWQADQANANNKGVHFALTREEEET